MRKPYLSDVSYHFPANGSLSSRLWILANRPRRARNHQVLQEHLETLDGLHLSCQLVQFVCIN